MDLDVDKLYPDGKWIVNEWKASIPVDNKNIMCSGVCLVYMRNGKIYRNDVYFDRSELLQEIMQHSSHLVNKSRLSEN